MSTNQLVVINSGSSSIKFALYEFNAALKKSLYGQVENITSAPVLKVFDSEGSLINHKDFNKDLRYEDYFEMLVSAFESNKYNFKVSGVGHRVVHGGNKYQSPQLVTHEILEELKEFIPFAPLHQPYNIKAIETIYNLYPNMPQAACFDTAFHHTHPPVANHFGLPRKLTDEGVRRYGFHGLSYEYIIGKLKEISPSKADGRVIVAHLGNGASMCAINQGKSVDSTMGFTAMDGLVMGTRCGSLDPGVVLFLITYKNMTSQEIENMLYKQSGLLGVSGISHDMKKLLSDSNPHAKEAVDLFVYRIRRELGALSSILGGLDILVFTGGIGEHAWQIREAVCRNNEWLGINIDTALNRKNQSIISTPQSRVEVRVIPTNEEWVIANHTYQLISKETS